MAALVHNIFIRHSLLWSYKQIMEKKKSWGVELSQLTLFGLTVLTWSP